MAHERRPTPASVADASARGPTHRHRIAVVAVHTSPPVPLELLRAEMGHLSRDGDLRLAPEGPMAVLHSPTGVAGLRAAGARIHSGLTARLAATDVWLGLGRPAARMTRVEDATREAEQAITLARIIDPRPRAASLEDVLLTAAVGQNRVLRSGLEAILAPLEREKPAQRIALLRSLEAFYHADLAITAARRIGVHRHTLENRIRRIERALGRSVREGPDRLLVEIALLAARLGGSLDDPSEEGRVIDLDI